MGMYNVYKLQRVCKSIITDIYRHVIILLIRVMKDVITKKLICRVLVVIYVFIICFLYCNIGSINSESENGENRFAYQVETQFSSSEKLTIVERFRPNYLSHLKNPCWYETEVHSKDRKQKLRCFPYFFLAGFPKCATTDLTYRIHKHSEVIRPSFTCPSWWTRGRFGIGNTEIKGPLITYLNIFNKLTQTLEDICPSQDKSESDCGSLISGDESTSTIFYSKETMREFCKSIAGIDGESLWEAYSKNRVSSIEPRRDRPFICSVDYSDIPFTNADLIRYVIPQARVIVLLRNPVERLYSSYFFFNSTRNKTAEDFDKQIDKAIETFNFCLRRKGTDRSCTYSLPHMLGYGLTIGIYSIYVQDWLNTFPRDQLLFIRTEDYRDAMEETILRVYDHLGLTPLKKRRMKQILKVPKKNQRKKSQPMLRSTRRKLLLFYQRFNRQLARILNDETFQWKEYYDQHIKGD